jgi:predicted Zn-ribbon and HTH transcriptional regulator
MQVEMEMINEFEKVECKDCGFVFYDFKVDRDSSELSCPKCQSVNLVYSLAQITTEIQTLIGE